MSELKSVPVTPEQPNKAQYGLSDLALFRLFDTREKYEAAFGVPAPEYDPSLRPKRWFDSTVDLTDPEELVAYTVAKLVAGVWTMKPIMMPAWEAAAVNIPPVLEGGVSSDHPFAKARPEWEMPLRALLPGESLTAGFGNTCVVTRADLANQAELNSGKFLAADRVLLTAIAEKLGVK